MMHDFKVKFTQFINKFYIDQFSHLNVDERERILETLGSTEHALNEFIRSDEIFITLPHASMNIFFPGPMCHDMSLACRIIKRKLFI